MPTRPGLIRFSDRQPGSDGQGPGLVAFAAWSRSHPDQKALLALWPGYVEPTVPVTLHGLTKTRDEKLQVYVAAARMVVNAPAASLDLARLASAEVLKRLDPAIAQRPLTAAEAVPNRDPDAAFHRRPGRAWCEGGAACFESRYDLEGKLPLGIKLANKLEDGGKKIAEHVTFQSEMRRLQPADLDLAAASRLTGITGPVASGFEQNIFWVNQIMRFGKLLALVQPAPDDAGRSVVSLYLALAVKADVLDRKKEYERVPVLRNLVPAQVLMGQSSFNTGQSLSAGLPVYARGRIKALAGILAGS